MNFKRVAVLLLLVFAISPQTSADVFKETEAGNYWPAIAVTSSALAGTFLISKMEEGPLVFAGLYGMTTLYSLNEIYRNSEDFTDYVVPVGLLTLVAINVLLLRDEDYDENDIFLTNLTGVGLLGGYIVWDYLSERKSHSYDTRLFPLYEKDSFGIALETHF